MRVFLSDAVLGAVISITDEAAQRDAAPWAPGWEMVAALGGVAAAAATVVTLIFVGRSARDAGKAADAAVASAKAAAEEAAGAWRPVVVCSAGANATIWEYPAPAPAVVVQLPVGLADEKMRSVLSMGFVNIGRGPAMSVRVRLMDSEGRTVCTTDGDTSISQGLLREADDDIKAAYVHLGPPSDRYDLTIECFDLGGRAYLSQISVNAMHSFGGAGQREFHVPLEVAKVAVTQRVNLQKPPTATAPVPDSVHQ